MLDKARFCLRMKGKNDLILDSKKPFLIILYWNFEMAAPQIIQISCARLIFWIPLVLFELTLCHHQILTMSFIISFFLSSNLFSHLT